MKNEYIISSLLVVLLILSSCGGDDDVDQEPVPEPDQTELSVTIQEGMIYWSGGVIQKFNVDQTTDSRDTILYDGLIYGISPEPTLEAAESLSLPRETYGLFAFCTDGAGVRSKCRHSQGSYEVTASFIQPGLTNYIRPFILTTEGVKYGNTIELIPQNVVECKPLKETFFGGSLINEYYYDDQGGLLYVDRKGRVNNSDGFSYSTNRLEFNFSLDLISISGYINCSVQFSEERIQGIRGDESKSIYDHTFTWLNDSLLSHKRHITFNRTEDNTLSEYDSAIYSFNAEGNIHKIEPYLLMNSTDYIQKPIIHLSYDQSLNSIKGSVLSLLYYRFPQTISAVEYFNANRIIQWTQDGNDYSSIWSESEADWITNSETSNQFYEYRVAYGSCN